jgi:putative nucleotidyltransferase with HDIG domain
MISPTLKGILGKWAKHLGTLPVIVIELLKVLEDPISTIDDLAELISRDQVLTAKLLRLVNSAYFGQRREVIDIRYAVSLVGFNGIRSLVLCTSLFEWHSPRKLLNIFSREDFWVHSIGVGFFAEKLAQKMNLDNPNDYFVAGLVHDIGKVFILQFMEASFIQIHSEATKQRISFHEAERICLETDHTEIGAWIMEKWKLPTLLYYCVKLHHSDVSQNRIIMPHEIVALANNLAKDRSIGSSGDYNQTFLNFRELKNKYGINQAWVDETGEYVRKETERCASLQGQWFAA